MAVLVRAAQAHLLAPGLRNRLRHARVRVPRLAYDKYVNPLFCGHGCIVIKTTASSTDVLVLIINRYYSLHLDATALTAAFREMQIKISHEIEVGGKNDTSYVLVVPSLVMVEILHDLSLNRDYSDSGENLAKNYPS